MDRNTCIGAATCIVVAPEAYELDDENIAIVKPEAYELDDEKLIMSAQACPVGAISLYNEEGKKIFPKE